VRQHLRHRQGRDEAQVAAAGLRAGAGEPGHGVGVARAQVDLLAAKAQGHAPAGARVEVLALQAQRALVPGGAGLHVGHVQHDVVEAVDLQGHGSGCGRQGPRA